MTTEFSQRLDDLLETLSWTRAELAHKCGITHQTVYRWKSQNRNPAPRSIDKIILVTGVSKDWLTSGQGRMFSGCADDKDQVFLKLGEIWNDLNDKQKQKIMVIAELLPPEIEANRPSPPYRKNLCDWIITSAAKYAGLDNLDITSLPPVLREYIKSGICDARCFWKCVSYYSDTHKKEIEPILEDCFPSDHVRQDKMEA